LGLSRGGAWLKLFIENTVVLFASLAATALIVLFSYKRFALSLLSIDEKMLETLKEVFANINAPFSFNWSASQYTLGLAAVISIITAGLSNILISRNAPLKLIRSYK
jgi:ABC-type antimicrobial peptide transport system permease subunit